MVGPVERRGDYVPGAATEHKTKEPLGCFVNVSGKCQTFIERGNWRPLGLSNADPYGPATPNLCSYGFRG